MDRPRASIALMWAWWIEGSNLSQLPPQVGVIAQRAFVGGIASLLAAIQDDHANDEALFAMLDGITDDLRAFALQCVLADGKEEPYQ